VSIRGKTSPLRFGPFVFVGVLFTWITAKIAYSFPDEFPALGLLSRWDGGWYESIARQGYVSPYPPLFQNSESSNVAFFPAYPLLSRAFSELFGISLFSAMPLVSIVCSVFLSAALLRHFARESNGSRFFRYSLLLAYPASFYLFVSYSEALYLAAMIGGAALALDSRRDFSLPASALILFSAFALGSTRLTGFVVPSFLLLGSIVYALRNRDFSELKNDFGVHRTGLFLGGAVAGTSSFFLYCLLKFGHWNLYFEQLRIGWYKEFSPLKALSILIHAPFPPALDYEVLLTESRLYHCALGKYIAFDSSCITSARLSSLLGTHS
jgi:hypothetical protein